MGEIYLKVAKGQNEEGRVHQNLVKDYSMNVELRNKVPNEDLIGFISVRGFRHRSYRSSVP